MDVIPQESHRSNDRKCHADFSSQGPDGLIACFAGASEAVDRVIADSLSSHCSAIAGSLPGLCPGIALSLPCVWCGIDGALFGPGALEAFQEPPDGSVLVQPRVEGPGPRVCRRLSRHPDEIHRPVPRVESEFSSRACVEPGFSSRDRTEFAFGARSQVATDLGAHIGKDVGTDGGPGSRPCSRAMAVGTPY